MVISMNISYDYYRIFYFVATCKNITQAAKALYLSQPNVTRTMKLLEQALGCTLFLRSRRGITLTPEGELLLSHVAPAVEHIESAQKELTLERELQQGSVSIGASEVALRCLLLPVLKKYQEKYPGVHLRISNHSTPQAVAALHETTADFAVITTPVTLSPSLTQTIVKEIREVPICAPAFSGLLGRSVALSELEAYPLITLGAGTTSHAFYVSVFTAQGVAFQPAIEAATADQIIPMAEAGLGVGIVPEAFIRPSDNVRRIELQEPLPLRAVCIVKRKGQPLSVAARELERMLLAAGAQST